MSFILVLIPFTFPDTETEVQRDGVVRSLSLVELEAGPELEWVLLSSACTITQSIQEHMGIFLVTSSQHLVALGFFFFPQATISETRHFSFLAQMVCKHLHPLV